MLTLTDSAVQAVKGIVSSSEASNDTGGLRVVAEGTDAEKSFRLSVATVPAEDDQVVEESGARVFLDSSAASLLSGKLLDAKVEDDKVSFVLSEQKA